MAGPTNICFRRACDCDICNVLPPRFICSDRFLVYQFSCRHCNDFYVGQTNRPFKFRYCEHSRAIKKFDRSSALTEHLQKHHAKLVNKSISDFKLQVIDKCADPVTTRVTEARYIRLLRPKINRKHELTEF